MPEFKVYWEIDVDADSPTDAAEIALDIMRDPASTATFFTVINEEGHEFPVDLA